VQFITADNTKILLIQSKGSEISPKPLHLISCYHATGKLSVQVPCDSKKKKQNVLQDGEIDHRQHAGIHSDSLHKNYERQYHCEKADIETFVTRESTSSALV